MNVLDLVLLSSSTNELVMWLIPFIASGMTGYGFYRHVWSRYRNAAATYHYETAPGVQVANMASRDDFVTSRHRLKRSKIEGHSRTEDPRNRV